MPRGLPLPLRQFCLGCGVGHVGNLPGRETDIGMQMQGNIQKNQGMPEVKNQGQRDGRLRMHAAVSFHGKVFSHIIFHFFSTYF